MATPTDEQQLRATLRRHERTNSADTAAMMAVACSIQVLGASPFVNAVKAFATGRDGGSFLDALPLPPLMGAAEAADVLGMKATNLKRLSPPLPVAAVISGRIPVYREADVMAAKARRDARRAGA